MKSHFRKKVAKHVLAKQKPPLDLKTKSKDFKIAAEENEVVSRTNRADLVFKVTIDEDKLKDKAKNSFDSDLKDWERHGKEDGEPKPVLDSYTQAEREHAAEELARVKQFDVNVKLDGTLTTPKYTYLKAQVLFQSKPIGNLSEAEFKYDGSEVGPVEESTYKLRYS